LDHQNHKFDGAEHRDRESKQSITGTPGNSAGALAPVHRRPSSTLPGASADPLGACIESVESLAQKLRVSEERGPPLNIVRGWSVGLSARSEYHYRARLEQQIDKLSQTKIETLNETS
jgi:hypothetical protein